MGRIVPLFLFDRAVTCALLAILAACPRPVEADETLAALRLEFSRHKDPVRRAKSFPRLGNALLAEMRRQIQEREYDHVSPLLVEYRDDATAAFDGLEAAGRDADRQPAGFRELEMHLRQSLHVVNDIVFALPLDDRDPLRVPQRDLQQLDQRLVKVLFPDRHNGNRAQPSAPPPHPE